MECVHCGSTSDVIKSGCRKLKKGMVQKYQCMKCKRYFSSSLHPYSRYSDIVILRSLELYNSGSHLDDVSKIIENEFEIKVPVRTIYSWLTRYEQRFSVYMFRGKRSSDGKGPLVEVELSGNEKRVLSFHSRKVSKRKFNCNVKDYIDLILSKRSIPEMNNLDPDGFSDKEMDYFLHSTSGSLKTISHLCRRMYTDPSKDEMMRFFLLNHPGCCCTSLPILPRGNEIWSGSIDIVFTESNQITLVQIAETEDDLKMIRDYSDYIKRSFLQQIECGNVQINSCIIFGDRIYTVKNL